VGYTYVVEGVTHEGRHTRFHGLDAGDFDHAERVVANLKPGSRVEVAYDPDDPATSTLATDPPNRALFGLGLVLVALGGLVMMSV
jgi:hypothetical protein